MMENADVNKVGSLVEPLIGSSSAGKNANFRWRSHLEFIVIPIGAILAILTCSNKRALTGAPGALTDRT
jgi:hypothetical protein